MKKYVVWVSNADSLSDAIEIDKDLLSYEGLAWDDAIKLMKLSFDQGYTCIIFQAELEA